LPKVGTHSADLASIKHPLYEPTDLAVVPAFKTAQRRTRQPNKPATTFLIGLL